MKQKILILSCGLLFLFNAKAQKTFDPDSRLNPIITGVPMLSIAPDARAGSMGDVGSATTPDIFSQHWNPAKYAFMNSPLGFSVSYTPWLSQLVGDINLGAMTGYWKITDNQALSTSIKYFSLGKVILMQYAGDPGIPAHPNEFSFDLAYSRMLSEKFSTAVAIRYVRSDLDVNSSVDTGSAIEMQPANGIAVDIAAYYNTPITLATGDANLAFGVNISNIGSKITYDVSNYIFLPANLKLGTSFEFPFDSYNRLSVSGDMNKLLVPTKGKMNVKEYNELSSLAGIFLSFYDAEGGFKEELKEITWSLGLEYSYNKQFFVRAGYQHQHENKGSAKYFTAGVGFKLNIFQLDAGYVMATAPSNPLDKTLRFSLSFDLFGLKELKK